MTRSKTFRVRHLFKKKGARLQPKLDTAFKCLSCGGEKSVRCKLKFEDGIGSLACSVCDVVYACPINSLSHDVDVYAAWVDAADAINNPKAPRDTRDNGEGTSEPTPRQLKSSSVSTGALIRGTASSTMNPITSSRSLAGTSKSRVRTSAPKTRARTSAPKTRVKMSTPKTRRVTCASTDTDTTTVTPSSRRGRTKGVIQQSATTTIVDQTPPEHQEKVERIVIHFENYIEDTPKDRVLPRVSRLKRSTRSTEMGNEKKKNSK
ncbi:hypothetical protein BGZ76_007973 [Entomortierella beljakovae]|nr:hypothetical protein BGZ76_007973 [Entomortierella beljakovae]